jgi:chromosome segregation ATPase
MEYSEVADQIRRYTRQLQAFEKAAGILTNVGSLEQAEKERRATLERLSTEIANAKLQLEKAREESARCKREAEQAVADAVAEAKRVIAEAWATAQAEAQEIAAEACNGVDAANERKAKIEAEAVALKANLEASRKELAEVEAKFAELKAKLASLKEWASAS